MTGSDPGGLRGTLADLETRCDELHTDLFDRLAEARDAGRDDLSPSENRAFADLKALTERRDEIAAEVARAGGDNITDLSSRIAKRNNMTTAAGEHSQLVYRKNDVRTSYVQDLIKTHLGLDDTYECRNRLRAHAEQVQTDPAFQETRDLSSVGGDGGYAIPPYWAMSEYIELARPGRAFANLCASKPLPGGTNSISIPKVISGTETAIQVADNTAVEEVDLQDDFINAHVQTVAGQQGVSIQLLEQSPLQFDQIVFGDLIADFATKVDLQVLHGTGTSGQVLGVDHTPGINTIAVSSLTVQGIYNAIANAVQTMHTTRFAPPTHLVCHPRRWGWLLAQLDDAGRPLFLPYTNMPQNAAGIMTDVASMGVVGSCQGIPIVVDSNITTTAGSGSGSGTEDVMYLIRANDLLLWESGVRARVIPQARASTLTTLLQVYGFIAFSAERYASSVCTITGLTAPTW